MNNEEKIKTIDGLIAEYNKIIKITKISFIDYVKGLGMSCVCLTGLVVAMIVSLVIAATGNPLWLNYDPMKCKMAALIFVFVDFLLVLLFITLEEKHNKRLKGLWNKRDRCRRNLCLHLIKGWGVSDRNQLINLLEELKFIKSKHGEQKFSSGNIVSIIFSTGMSITIMGLELFLHKNEDKFASITVMLGVVLTVALATVVIAIAPTIKMILSRENQRLDNFIITLYDILNFEEGYNQV